MGSIGFLSWCPSFDRTKERYAALFFLRLLLMNPGTKSSNGTSDADVNVALDIPVLTGYSDCLTILKIDPVPSPIH